MDLAETLSDPVLVADTDRTTTSLLAAHLEQEGFRPLCAHDGRQALELARRHSPVLVILDLALSEGGGRGLCRELRQSSDTPILMLSSRKEEVDCLLSFSMGADDYVVKPCSPRELTARIRAILRRARAGPARGKVLSHEGLALDPEKRAVSLDGRRVSLTPLEYKLLYALMSVPGRVFLRDELLNRIYPAGEVVIDRVIDVHVGRLRQKIEKDVTRPRHLLTVRGVGYQFAENGRASC